MNCITVICEILCSSGRDTVQCEYVWALRGCFKQYVIPQKSTASPRLLKCLTQTCYFCPSHLYNVWRHVVNIRTENTCLNCKTAHLERESSRQAWLGPWLSVDPLTCGQCAEPVLFIMTLCIFKSSATLCLHYLFIIDCFYVCSVKYFVHLYGHFYFFFAFIIEIKQKDNNMHIQAYNVSRKGTKKKITLLGRDRFQFSIRRKFCDQKCNSFIVFTTIIWFL